MAPAVPDAIGVYKVLERIGQGGMGTLYRARDPRIGRDVAIKLLREGLDDDEMRERFAREARSAGGLKHGNIVTVFEFGEHRGRPFIAMEYVQGETLAAILERRPALSLARKLQIMDQLCGGLSYAHRMDVVHRDIKPANIMIDGEGTVKILDFGIARMGPSGATGMTKAGMLMGTLNYMAPEQMEGKPVDARADIFSIGAVFYELLSFRPAFPGDALSAVMHKILYGGAEPIEVVCPHLDSDIVTIINSCLQKQPENRYQDLEAMRRALTAVRRRVAAAGTGESDGAPSSATEVRGQFKTPLPRSGRRDSAGADRLRLRAEQMRADQIQSHIERGRRAVDNGEYDAAFEACEQALVLDPDNADALDLEERTRHTLEQQWLDQANAEFARGALTAASLLVDRVLGVNPESKDALDLGQAIGVARAFRRALGEAQQSLADGSLDAAAEAIEQALTLDPTDAEAVALKEEIAVAMALAAAAKRQAEEEARARQALANATQLFGRGDHAGAFALLEDLAPRHASVAEVLTALKVEAREMERRRAEAERLTLEAEKRRREKEEEERRIAEAASRVQREVDGHLTAAARAVDERQWARAREHVESATRIDPANVRTVALRVDIEAAVAREQLTAINERGPALDVTVQLPRKVADLESTAPSGNLPATFVQRADVDVPKTTRVPRRRVAGAWVRKPAIIGALVFAAVIIAAVAEYVRQSERSGRPATQQQRIERPTEQPADEARQHVANARASLDRREYTDALNELDQVLARDPANPDAMALRARANELRATASIEQPALTTLPALQTPPVSRPTQNAPPETTGALKPNAVSATKAASPVSLVEPPGLVERYARAKSALDTGVFSTAVSLLDGIQREAPGFRDVGALLARARGAMSAAAREALEAGNKLEGSDDLMGALREYSRVQQIDPSMAASAEQSIALLKARMKAEATDALSRAKLYYASDRINDAITWYERAYRNLLDDDPDKKLAKARLDELRARK
jgi:tetratricopeptide (TPR) repeat protein